MGRRGARPFEEKVGEDKFKELLKRLSIEDIAKLYCDHFLDEEDKARCKSCKRTIYRAKKRVEAKSKAQKRYDPIEQFAAIPEIQSFIEYMEAKKVKYHHFVLQLKTMWTWIREAKKPDGSEYTELRQTQRPALWGTPHIKYILKKVHKRQVSSYKWKQALRRFFESQGRLAFLKNPLLTARVQDMRSPKGTTRLQDRFQPREFPKIAECLDKDELFTVKMHVTVKSREGDRGKRSLLDARWKDVNWKDEFYGFPMVTISIFETKTKGGTWWEHIPVDMWFGDLSKELRERFEAQGCSEEGYVLPFNYEEYRKVWKKISKHVGKKLEPHDCRRSPAGWLRDLGEADLAIGQYNPNTGRAIGYIGVGWENSKIYYDRYGKRNPLAIYDKEKRLDIKVFDGLIHKILENK